MMRYSHTLRLRLLWVIGLNAGAGLLIAIVTWWSQSGWNFHLLPLHLADSFIHSAIYGTSFGLAMPYLAERLATLEAPWNWTSIIASLAAIAIVGSVLVELCLLASGLATPGRFWPELGYKSASVFLIALIVALCIWAYEVVRNQIRDTHLELRTQQFEKERALKLLSEARFNSLQSRLHPHFLFNTLNGISSLITENPELAEQLIQRLSALLRVSLDGRERTYIALKEELNLVLDYVEIERARLGERLSFSLSTARELDHLAIPPMSLQPLVENSIAYAVSPRLEGGHIKLWARRQADKLIISVWDNGPGFEESQISNGRSIDNLRSRLALLFGDAASLSIAPLDGGNVMIISMPVMNISPDQP